MHDIERITSLYTKFADANFDEGTKLAKFKVLIPTSVYKFIAIAAVSSNDYGDSVQLVEAHNMDPPTGPSIG